eukprot:scaffold259_cov252-Pinguiococcus_pyrenoidosus.AAC.18
MKRQQNLSMSPSPRQTCSKYSGFHIFVKSGLPSGCGSGGLEFGSARPKPAGRTAATDFGSSSIEISTWPTVIGSAPGLTCFFSFSHSAPGGVSPIPPMPDLIRVHNVSFSILGASWHPSDSPESKGVRSLGADRFSSTALPPVSTSRSASSFRSRSTGRCFFALARSSKTVDHRGSESFIPEHVDIPRLQMEVASAFVGHRCRKRDWELHAPVPAALAVVDAQVGVGLLNLLLGQLALEVHVDHAGHHVGPNGAHLELGLPNDQPHLPLFLLGRGDGDRDVLAGS